MKLFTLLPLALLALLAACSALPATDDGAGASVTPEPSTAADTPTVSPAVRLDDAGPAPEIANDTWINSDPLTLESQRGKVVLLEFWTFGCINCQRVIPYVRQWYDDYSGENFQIISIHYPEFARERELSNVVEAVERFEIAYPVALDNDGRTWRAYNQRYWPTTYLIDKDGHIRYKHIGEFSDRSAAATEAAIETLLKE